MVNVGKYTIPYMDIRLIFMANVGKYAIPYMDGMSMSN